MITLLNAVTHAFAEGGPVQAVKGQHRPLQAEAANGFATYVQNDTSGPDIRPWIQQQQAGIGKTTIVPVVLGLLKLLAGHNSIISTFTRPMRNGYLTEFPATNEIVKRTLHDLGESKLYRPLIMAEYQSVTPYFSPSKMAALRKRIEDGVVTDQIAIDMLKYFTAAEEHGGVPSFSDFYAEGGILPANDPLRWCMCSADKSHPLWKEIMAGNEEAIDADLLLVTHAMLIRSNIARGKVLQTDFEDDEQRWTGICAIDEADKIPQVTMDAETEGTTHNTILDTLDEFLELYTEPRTKEVRDAIQEATTSVQAGLHVLRSWMETHTRPLVIDRSPEYGPMAKMFIDAFASIETGLKVMRHITLGDYHRNDRDILLSDRIRSLRQGIAVIERFARESEPKLIAIPFTDLNNENDLGVYVNFGSGRQQISRLVERRQSGDPYHTFCGAAFVSATLADAPPHINNYSWFLLHTGLNKLDTAIPAVLPPLPQNHRRFPFGSITEVAVISRDCPHPTDETVTNMINQEYITRGTVAIRALAQRQQTLSPDTRMLVLFPSFDLMDEYYDRLHDMADFIVQRTKHSNLTKTIAQYAATPHGVWFGVEWEGVNFIDPNPPKGQLPRTLADFLVITRIPQPPTDLIRVNRLTDWFEKSMPAATAERLAEGFGLHEAVGMAYRRSVQGVARGIRNAADVIQLLAILDARFPVPQHIADTRRIARSANDRNKLYTQFDVMLDRYGVKRWSQIDKDGRITPITR